MNDPYMPVAMHTERPRGDRTCSHTTTGRAADDCGEAATWHVAWDIEVNNSLACDEHMALIERTWVFDDRHPVGADCNMPGALWSYRLGCCHVPTDDANCSVAEAVSTGA